MKLRNFLTALIALSIALPAFSQNKKEVPRILHINAKSGSISIDASKTAVIVIDMQNYFGAKGGMFDRVGINISEIQKAIGPTAKVLAAARQAGIQVIYLKMGYHADLSDIGSKEAVSLIRNWHVGDTVTAPNGSKERIFIRDTWNTDIVPELKPHDDDIVIYKTRYSGFYQTDLDSVLKQSGKQYLIFTGCTTSVCVESTVRDASFRDYIPVVLEDCTAEPIGYNLSRSNHEASLLTIQTAFGKVSNSEDFIKSLKVQSISKDQKLQ